MYRVTSDLAEINFMPQTELEEIIQNVKTILTTVQGEVPLDRKLGVDANILDLPISIAQAKITAAIVKAINEFEPRARVKQVTFKNSLTETADGILRPVIDIELIERNLRGYVLTEDKK